MTENQAEKEKPTRDLFDVILKIIQLLVIPALLYFSNVQKDLEHRITALETKVDIWVSHGGEKK